jgi:replicative DNA helicase
MNGNMNPDLVYEANQKYAAFSQQMWTLEMPLETSFQQAIMQMEKIVVSLGRMPVIMIDNMQRIPFQQSNEEQIKPGQFLAAITYRLKECSREWQCPIVASLLIDDEQRQLPLAIEATADVVLELNQAGQPLAHDRDYPMQLSLRKNRNGNLIDIPLIFRRAQAVFVDA